MKLVLLSTILQQLFYLSIAKPRYGLYTAAFMFGRASGSESSAPPPVPGTTVQNPPSPTPSEGSAVIDISPDSGTEGSSVIDVSPDQH